MVRRAKQTFLQIKQYRWPKSTWKDTQHHWLLKKCKSKLQWGTTSHQSLKVYRQYMLERWREGNPPTLFLEMWVGAVTVENSIGVSQKTKNRTRIWPSNSTPEHIFGKDENSNSKRHMHPSVHCSTIYNSQEMEATKCPWTHEWIKKM